MKSQEGSRKALRSSSVACCEDSDQEACEVNRRAFLKSIGASAAAGFIAGPFNARAEGAIPGLSPDHFVPVDKKLRKEWIEALFQKGGRRIFRGEQRAAVAMPVGGIGAGQIYFGPDGTLRHWAIMNQYVQSGFGAKNYEFRVPERIVDHGFAIAVKDAKGKVSIRSLREEDFPGVELIAEYPIAEARYADENFPVEVRLRGFSPFIPLEATMSSLPSTFLQIAVRNKTRRPLQVAILCWLENKTGMHTGKHFHAKRSNSFTHGDYGTWMECSISAEPLKVDPPEIFANFDGENYADWIVEGTAFGSKPATGTFPTQQIVSGHQGAGLVNSGHDDLLGSLTSPVFTIKRDFINFLIGGGANRESVAIQLLIGGKVVASKAGKNLERLEWAHFNVAEHKGKEATIKIVDSAKGGWGHINVDQIEFADVPRVGNGGGDFASQGDAGQMGMIFFEKMDQTLAHWPQETPLDQLLNSDFKLPEASPKGEVTEYPRAIASRNLELRPGAIAGLDTALVWHFPNSANGHYQQGDFKGARDVAMWIAERRSTLMGGTFEYHAAYNDSTLPQWLLDRLHAPVSTLATNTVEVWRNGRFWAWEGVGCCEGTCTHVWNYEHATARLFPEFSRSNRVMQDLGVALQEDGVVGFRGNNAYAADGQVGTILKCYREHLISADDAFLKTNWPKIKRAMEYSIGHDSNDDGLIEDRQHNTYDIEFYGPNPFVGSLYLAALRAAEEMARRVGDTDFATRCRKIFESGSRLSMERMFNGEFFEQRVDLNEHPRMQFAKGCLCDQMFGQGWAHQVGLGHIYPVDAVRKTLESIYKYNWAPDVGPQTAHHAPDRYFARRGDSGLFICTWPYAKHPGNDSVLYRDEVWTGCEYQVAGHMIWEGMLTEAFAILRGVHERYSGLINNPFNEVECGDHYARAMASWGCLTALSGFEYDGPAGIIGFAPRLTPENFRVFFSASEGWGTFAQNQSYRHKKATLEPRWGKVRLNEFRLQLPEEFKTPDPKAQISKEKIEFEFNREGRQVAFRFAKPVVIEKGQILELEVR